MTRVTDGMPQPRARWQLALKIILTIAAMLVAFNAVAFHRPEAQADDRKLVDFDAYYVAGSLGLEGKASEAYRMKSMVVAQQRFTGRQSFMPWTYPPPFTLAVTGLAALPLGLAYALFVGLSFGFYVMVLHRIAGPHLPATLIGILPTALLTLATGQNGFLTGGLIGLFLLAFLQRRPGAGIPLGLMVIKPHLAVAITVLVLLERRWRSVAIAALVVSIALLVPTLVFGPSIWPAFLAGVRESSGFLADGRYPLFRMTSLYATLRSAGLSADLAFAVQGCGAALALGLLVLGWIRGLPPHWLAAAVCAASLFVSPYNYDYDLCILGVGLAFILPDLLVRTRRFEQVALLALCWFGTGYGFVSAIVGAPAAPGTRFAPVSLMGPALLLLVGLVVLALRREVRAMPGGAAVSAVSAPHGLPVPGVPAAQPRSA